MKYIYPPRPETKIAPESLNRFEEMGVYFAEVKLNGSSMEVYTNGNTECKTMNRHKEPIACKISKEELLSLHKGNGDIVLCGELMNKGQKDETGKVWNNVYVIWDIIVYNGEHLLGRTFEERYELLKTLYPNNPVKKYLHQISDNCYRIEKIDSKFMEVFKDICKYDMYEGLVMKRKDGKLENGTTATNNTRTQIKCRKPTKNYNF